MSGKFGFEPLPYELPQPRSLKVRKDNTGSKCFLSKWMTYKTIPIRYYKDWLNHLTIQNTYKTISQEYKFISTDDFELENPEQRNRDSHKE